MIFVHYQDWSDIILVRPKCVFYVVDVIIIMRMATAITIIIIVRLCVCVCVRVSVFPTNKNMFEYTITARA